MKKVLMLLLQIASLGFLYAQHAADNSPVYNPHGLFSQDFNPPAGNAFRSANGTPGPMYWQNSASYLIHAVLSEKDTTISGSVVFDFP